MYEMLVLTKSCFFTFLFLSAHSFDFERYVLMDCIFREEKNVTRFRHTIIS